MTDITVAILAKDKEYCLPFYLRCLLNQTYPKDKIHLYVRTNDNKDGTEQLLENFLKLHGHMYKSVFYDNSSINPIVKNYEEHEWNSERFNILASIRQDSINFALARNSDYFVADCDNFICPTVIEDLEKIKYLGVVGPMLPLSKRHGYSNYHNKSCPLGYFEDNPSYYPIVKQEITGIISVDTIHCTYYVRNELLKQCSYFDSTDRYEYARFSNNLRDLGIPQYVDNRKFNGFLFLNDQIPVSFEQFIDIFWKEEFEQMSKNIS